MHEIWLWEKYYDDLDALDMNDRAESPVDYRGQKAGEDEGVRGRAGFQREFEDDDIAARIPPPLAASLRKDSLTADSFQVTRTEEDLLPCHYFDFMFGTSTGGLIATILGRLRMTTTEGLELYRKVGNDLFGSRRSSIPLTTKYYHEPLEKAVQKVVAQRCGGDGNALHPWDPSALDVPFDVDQPRVCQSACLTATHDGQLTEAYLLRTYSHYYNESTPNWISRYNEGADPLPIWAVTRATSAAPFYFDIVRSEVDGTTRLFKDGGIRENNPSGAAFSEFHSLYSGKAPHPALLLSLGTGRPNQTLDGFAQTTALPSPFHRLPFVAKFLENLAIFQNVLIKYTEGEHQHIALRNAARGEYTWYKRLNPEGLETMPLDDWRKGPYRDPVSDVVSSVPGGATLADMEAVVATYLARNYDDNIDSYAPPKVMLRQSARKLVLQRRAREREGGPRWEAFIADPFRASSMTTATPVSPPPLQQNGHAK